MKKHETRKQANFPGVFSIANNLRRHGLIVFLKIAVFLVPVLNDKLGIQ